MRSIKNLSRRTFAWTAAGLGSTAVAGIMAASVGLTPAVASSGTAHQASTFTFALVPSPNIAACLPNAGGSVTITTGKQNDTMKVTTHGLPKNAGFDLFVIQQPLAPFGVSWYQTDVNANDEGVGSATVKGVFDSETFSVSPGGTVTFPPTNQYHLGLWFNNPQTPFNLGCEPGATAPIVTPFNGAHHAGIQVLNTSEFPVAAGPLSQVHR